MNDDKKEKEEQQRIGAVVGTSDPAVNETAIELVRLWEKTLSSGRDINLTSPWSVFAAIRRADVFRQAHGW